MILLLGLYAFVIIFCIVCLFIRFLRNKQHYMFHAIDLFMIVLLAVYYIMTFKHLPGNLTTSTSENDSAHYVISTIVHSLIVLSIALNSFF